MHVEARHRQQLVSLSESRFLRFLMVFTHYVAQGVPVGLFFFAIPAWLTANGATASETGAYISLTTLAWSLKFLNGFLMDRYTYLPMGRRRIWLIGAQLTMVVGLLSVALINPTSDEVMLISICSFLINVATSYQDVAIDGTAVDLMPIEDRARANGFMFGGQSVGVAAGGAVSGIIIVDHGLREAMLVVAAFVACVLVLIIIFRERPGEKIFPWSNGETAERNKSIQVEGWAPLIKGIAKAMFRVPSLIFCAMSFSTGIFFGIYLAMMPLIATNVANWQSDEYSSLAGTASVVSGVIGFALLGPYIDRVGWKKAAVQGLIAMAILVGAMVAIQQQWSNSNIIIAFMMSFVILNTFVFIMSGAAAMSFCSLKVAATQFTLYMALGNLGISLGGASLSILDELGGYRAMMIGIVTICLFSALLVKFIGKENPDIES